MNHSLWPVALAGGLVCAYLPVGSAAPLAAPERVAVAAAPEPEPASAATPTGTRRLPGSAEVRTAIEHGAEKAASAARHAGDAVKREVQRFEREHPEAGRPSTTTITTGDPRAPLVIRQHAASQP